MLVIGSYDLLNEQVMRSGWHRVAGAREVAVSEEAVPEARHAKSGIDPHALLDEGGYRGTSLIRTPPPP